MQQINRRWIKRENYIYRLKRRCNLKLDIRRKVLLLVLSGSLLTFLLLAVF